MTDFDNNIMYADNIDFPGGSPDTTKATTIVSSTLNGVNSGWRKCSLYKRSKNCLRRKIYAWF